LAVERLDRDLQSVNEPTSDRDQTGWERIHLDVAPVRSCTHHAWVVIEVEAFRQTPFAPVTKTPGNEHRVVAADRPVRARQPTKQVGL